jgi:hypothetical protein
VFIISLTQATVLCGVQCLEEDIELGCLGDQEEGMFGWARHGPDMACNRSTLLNFTVQTRRKSTMKEKPL